MIAINEENSKPRTSLDPMYIVDDLFDMFHGVVSWDCRYPGNAPEMADFNTYAHVRYSTAKKLGIEKDSCHVSWNSMSIREDVAARMCEGQIGAIEFCLQPSGNIKVFVRDRVMIASICVAMVSQEHLMAFFASMDQEEDG